MTYVALPLLQEMKGKKKVEGKCDLMSVHRSVSQSDIIKVLISQSESITVTTLVCSVMTKRQTTLNIVGTRDKVYFSYQFVLTSH